MDILVQVFAYVLACAFGLAALYGILTALGQVLLAIDREKERRFHRDLDKTFALYDTVARHNAEKR